MTTLFREGAVVRWSWGAYSASGKVEQRFERQVSRTLKGKRIRRHGSTANPAYLIRQDDGYHVLKLGSELERA